MSITILLADSHTLMRKGLRSLLEKQPGMEVVAEAEDGRTTVQLALEFSPDVIIVDVFFMPGLSGIEAIRRILARNHSTKIVALSLHSDRMFVAKALRAGVSAYLLKDRAFEDLVRAIHAVLAGQTYLSPEIAVVVVEDYVRRLKRNGSLPSFTLTRRESEVLHLLAEGKNTQQIAFRLGIGVKTAGTYRRRIMKRLDVGNMVELTKYAIRTGLTSLEP